MKGTIYSVSSLILLGTIFSLAGCGANNQGQYDYTALERKNSSAFRYINDRGFNDQQMIRQVNQLDDVNNRGTSMGAYSKGGDYGYEDYNYHGHLNTTFNGVPTRSYNSGYDNVIAQKITDRLEHVANVKDVAAFIDGDYVLVAIDTDLKDSRKLENKVRRIVEGMAIGRNVKVVTDKNMFNHDHNVNSR